MFPVTAVSLDVGEFLAHCHGPSIGRCLAQASPLPPGTVSDLVAVHLHRASELDPEVIATVASELRIEPAKLTAILQAPRPLQVDPRARPLLIELRAAFPQLQLVVCSNVSAADPDHPAIVRNEFADLIDRFYFSCELGLAKGHDSEIFERIIDDLGLEHPEQLLHVGDKPEIDAAPALQAGCRALLVNPAHAQAPRLAGHDRYRTAHDLAAGIAETATWVVEASKRHRSTLPVRASVLIRDGDHLLITRGPDDRRYSLPGGRAESTGREPPPATAVREVAEELGVHVELGDVLWWGWSESEATDGHNKIVIIFAGRLADGTATEFAADPGEIEHVWWATETEADAALHPREADRIRRIAAGATHGWQHTH